MKDQQQLDNKSLTAEAKYPINLNNQEKDLSEIKDYVLRLRNFQKILQLITWNKKKKKRIKSSCKNVFCWF